MKRLLAAQTGLAIVTSGLACLMALPATALAGQADRAGAGGGAAGGGGGVASSGGSGGAMSASGGGGGDRAGAGGGFVGGGSSSDPGGNRAGATGGSGIAMPRGADHGGGMGAPRHAGGGSGSVAPRAGGRTQDNPGEREPSGVPRYSRPHDPNVPSQGTAVPRPPNSTPNVKGGGPTYIIPGGYYGGYYGIYGYGYGGGYFGGYYDPWYDPWYGGYPSYGGGAQTYSSADEGALRLKIKPRDAEVYVDGYFVGIVDEFDGVFQRLHIESGVHRVEVRAPGYDTLVFEVRIVPDRKTTYQGEMHRIQ